MSDITSKKIGTVLAPDDTGRDAIHIAVVPVVADMDLRPGQHIGLQSDGTAVVASTDFGVAAIGIVDPYLRRVVTKGQRVFLFLYPNTITSLRHEWTHPAFGAVAGASELPASEVWLRGFAEDVGVSYRRLMEGAEDHLSGGYDICLSYDTPDRVYDDRRAFWMHYAAVTGKAPKDPDAVFFRCSC